MFIYVGGESDEWVEKILKNINPKKTKVIKLIDLTDTKVEELVEGMEQEKEESLSALFIQGLDGWCRTELQVQ